MLKKLMVVVLATVALVACASQKKTDDNASEEVKQKVLVLYYSQTGATKAVAEEIQKQLGADIEAIEAVTPYDGDFQQTIVRCQKEMGENKLPELKPLKVNVKDYDVVFVGFPVWFGTFARPMTAFLDKEKFEGKKVVPFCTFGSGGLEACTKELKSVLPKAEVADGYGVRNARVAAIGEEVTRFLIEGGYKEGEIEKLPAFGEHKSVTDAEKAIFDTACGDYQFPLGTPVDVASREVGNNTEYEFGVESQGQGGEAAKTTIYVVVGKAEGSKAEFTRVVR